MEFRNEYTYELIEDFLLGNLAPEKIREVENLLKTQPGFAEEVEWMKTMLDLPNRKRELQALEEFRQYRRRSLMQVVHKRLRGAAAVAASALVGVFFWNLHTEKNREANGDSTSVENPALPSNNATAPVPDTFQMMTEQLPKNPPPPLPPLPHPPDAPSAPLANKPTKKTDWMQSITFKEELQTLGDEENEALASALSLMDSGKRKEALSFLERYLAALPEGGDDLEFRLETGKIYLAETNNIPKAVFHFTRAFAHAVTDGDKAAARFYLAIADLANGKTASAKKALEAIADGDATVWKEKAKEALSRME